VRDSLDGPRSRGGAKDFLTTEDTEVAEVGKKRRKGLEKMLGRLGSEDWRGSEGAALSAPTIVAVRVAMTRRKLFSRRHGDTEKKFGGKWDCPRRRGGAKGGCKKKLARLGR